MVQVRICRVMPAQAALRPLQALLIDDNPADCLLAQEALDCHIPQVNVKIIQDGIGALAWLRPQHAHPALCDVILLNVNMPGMNGCELLAAIRGDAALRHLPVVMLTTSDRPEDIDRTYDLIVSSYLVKQREFSQFLVQIKDFVRFWTGVRYRQGVQHRA